MGNTGSRQSCAPSCFAPMQMQHSQEALMYDDDLMGQRTSSIAINSFQMCKKGEIMQENIEMQMRLVSKVTASEDDSYDEDDLGSSDEEDNGDFMARCQSLTYNVEIGELHERDKFTWTESKGMGRRSTTNLEDKKLKQLDFKFKLNHIKQVIKVEINGQFRPKKGQKLPEGQNFYEKKLFVGFYNFARCVLKDGKLSEPHSVSQKVSRGIDVKLSLEEKAKKGGYRCVTLKVFDYKGGDFVENQDLTMVVVDQHSKQVLAEVRSHLPLQQSPEGLFKRVEIGINNYDPSQFMSQAFTIFFFKENQSKNENESTTQTLISTDDEEQKVRAPSSNTKSFGLIAEMPRGEYEVLMDRIENDLVAWGEFQASELVENGICQDDFVDVEPRMTQNNTVAGAAVTAPAQKPATKTKSSFLSGDDNIEIDDNGGFKLSLFNKDKTQTIGVISLRNIQCKRRTSFLNLIADQMVEIVPIIGIDFSMANLTFDEAKCLHVINQDKTSVYRNLLQATSKAFKLISPTSLFYGFGANSVMKQTEVSDLFVGTGDLLNPIVMTDSLENEYNECLKRVELNLPVKFSCLIKKSVEFAERSAQHFLNNEDPTDKLHEGGHALTYFVIYIFAAGIIDDLDDSIRELTRVINLPVSIVIVQLKNKGLSDQDTDVGKLEEKCEFLFEKANRRFLKVLKLSQLGFGSGGTSLVMDRLTEQIPFEVEQYYDTISPHSDLARLKLRQNQIRKGFDLVREVLHQKEAFLVQVEAAGIDNVTRDSVSKLIEEFKLYEYSIDSAEILLGLKKRIDRS